MKKTYFLSVTIVFLLITGCTVNYFTGKIQIMNLTGTSLQNLKIGNTLITTYVAPGDQIDYWYYNSITGKLSVSGVDHFDVAGRDPNEDNDKTGFDKLTYYFNVNQWVIIQAKIVDENNVMNIDIEPVDKGDTFIAIAVYKQNSDNAIDEDEWCEE